MTDENYYNENDPDAAAVLRVLIAEGRIAPGIVDERSIEDVVPDELAGFTQCHFFAGFGIWSLALRQAGWPDDRKVWTGSCPCQPFSAAGKGDGFADERHLWPHFYHLISQCRPAEILGEQVAAKAVEPWIDLVHADLEAVGYAFGCVPFPSAGVGAPHIRDRNYWAGRLGDAHNQGPQGHAGHGGAAGWSGQAGSVAATGLFGGLADSSSSGWREEYAVVGGLAVRDSAQGLAARLVHGGSASGMAHAEQERHDGSGAAGTKGSEGSWRLAAQGHGNTSSTGQPGPTNGLWGAADWLLCRDGKWRPVEPGTFPLAHAGTFRNRVATLRGAGNAINLAAAQAFIESVMGAA